MKMMMMIFFPDVKGSCFAGYHSTSGCDPGWHRASESCYLFYFQSTYRWDDARTFCHSVGADLAVINDRNTMQDLANQRREMKLDDRDLYLGLRSQMLWNWLDGEVVSKTNNLWGPHEPSGYGKCGSFLNGITWDSSWLGYGWRWSDISCTYQLGYICQQPLGMIQPAGITKPLGITLHQVFMLLEGNVCERCPIHSHCNNPLKAYSVCSIRKDR